MTRVLQSNKTMNAALAEDEIQHELKKTRAELEQAILTIKPLHAQLCSIRKDRFGKCMIGRDYEVDSKDYLVMDHEGKCIHKDFWPYHKFLPGGWGDYSEVVGSVCHYIFQNVTLPPHMDKATYWILTITPSVNRKFIVMRANFEEQIRKQQSGKQLPVWIHFVAATLSNRYFLLYAFD